MGKVLSKVYDEAFKIRALISEILTTKQCFDDLVSRVSAVTFPVTNPTSSFWQNDPVFPELVNMQSENLPETADIVIIGSGISGASVAYSILNGVQNQGKAKQPLRIVMIEARETCSGATGRNGGHIKCAAYLEYSSLKSRYGIDSAKKILQFQRRHMPILLDMIQQMGLDSAEAKDVETVDIFTDEKVWNEAKLMVQELRDDFPDAAEDIVVHDGSSGCEQYNVDPQHCYGIMSYRAAALSPYRFITALYASLLASFPSDFSIETKTLATDIRIDSKDSGRPFVVTTPRGNINATHVVHATDAFAANLIPGLKGKLFPLRGHMTAQSPGTHFAKLAGSRSWCFHHKRGFDYISQRPGEGELMVGGGVIQSQDKGIDEFGIWRDDQISYPVLAYLNGLMPTIFGTNIWGVDEAPRAKQAWTGCMGFTPDLLPFVGKLEDGLTQRKLEFPSEKDDNKEAAEWISAGFQGEGMVMAWLSGVAVGMMIIGDEEGGFLECPGIPEGNVQDWLPREFVCSKQRVDKLSLTDMATLL
ncbi:hypothetical protein N7509_011734 [Penicillium cosmopolitanum]|uniref:FAD dependent oxidoreductase domain-containing protein n=1 Tax=Penicillium cosmopolitanum TaxID=1131564 RepID=A0A9W9SIH5_9EURO|nr:uncharacterized protein N7509_011734 [Penicillium cosmopolitanum]KAJ5378615.1 hypothetical protein N7509_011734 [Penicillium cosmopolitanum]